MLGAARRRECPRQRELPEVLVTNIEGWAERVGAELAAKAFGVAPRTWRHHAQKQRGELPERPSRATGKPRRPHPAKLTDEEEQEVVDTLCSEEFVDVGVDEVFVTILDDGIYLCSPSTMHRILRDRGLNGQRRQGNPRQGHPRPRVVATAPNMVWVWDIERHEALSNLAVVKGHRPPVRRSGRAEAEGSLNRGTPGRVEAALTTTGRASTVRWCGVQLARRKGVREEPATESPSREDHQLESDRSGLGCNAHPDFVRENS
jgi:hypothetical protein